MINALWRFILTLIFVTSLFLVLSIIWDVPKYLGYELPWDFAKLPSTLLIFLAIITGIWGTWTREIPKKIKERPKMHYTDPIVPKEDIFAAPPPTSGELSMVEQANQVNKTL